MKNNGTKSKREIDSIYFLKNLFYTIIINTIIAVLLSMNNMAQSFPKAMVIAQSIGICIYAIIVSFFAAFKPKNAAFEILIVLIGIVGGLFIGWIIAVLIMQHLLLMPFERPGKVFQETIILGVAFGALCSSFFIFIAKLKESKERVQEETIKRLAKEKEALESKLKMLQAQIEPHFLFNTLSNILSLVKKDPVKGRDMLIDLIHYLRTALSRTRQKLITIDQEIEFIQTYLDIIKIRMADRLRFAIVVPEHLKTQSFPPMLLQPLVENAVKHGLEPKIEGGEILVKVDEAENFLKLEVIDTGLGLTANHTGGIGIANVRERLHLLYGEKGRLRLEENTPYGSKVMLELPKHNPKAIMADNGKE